MGLVTTPSRNKKMKIIFPLPNHGFDPTETAVSWKILRAAGFDVCFATPDGKRGYADPIMITGEGLDPWGRIPGLKKIKLVGLMLRAGSFARACYRALENDLNFLNPKKYDELSVNDYDGLLLSGGHAPPMKEYLESKTLQALVVDFFESLDSAGNHKPVAAICHGVLVAARSISPQTGKSVLHGKKTVALTWAMEKSAWNLTRYLCRFWDSTYYRTYIESKDDPPGHWSVEMEVKRNLEKPEDFVDVPRDHKQYFIKTSGLFRDGLENDKPSWVVRDGNYVSARWPGDTHAFAHAFVQVLKEKSRDR
ncbi:MAG: thiJ/pfpI-family protein [Deltaproteobacteria bacterium]|nr:thiJ/pfpI-family protein [Deltaproteobacteria bacterium]